MTEKTDRPRRGGEDVVTWAVETGRIAAAAADKTRSDIAMCRNSEAALEAMASPYPAPKPAAPPAPAKPPAPSRPAAPPATPPPAAAARPAPVRAAGEDNPVAVLLREMPSAYQQLVAAGAVPDLFPGSGTLPASTASGMDPYELSAAPAWCRPAIAEAATMAEAKDLLEIAKTDPAMAEATDRTFTSAAGYVDFRSRVEEGLMRVTAQAEETRRLGQERQARAVAAAAHKPVTEMSDDELYAAAFAEGDRHRADLLAARARGGDRVGGPWHG